MKDDIPRVAWTRMEDGTAEDWALLDEVEAAFNADLVDRLMAHLKTLDVDWGGYQVTRYEHSLQSATLAERDGADEEMIVAALLHDIGDILAPYNHSQMAAAVLKPYVSERVHWIVEHHGLFQGYYYLHFIGGDRNARDKYKDHPYYEDCVYFCQNYDQNAFDPDLDTLPVGAFRTDAQARAIAGQQQASGDRAGGRRGGITGSTPGVAPRPCLSRIGSGPPILIKN